MATPYSILPVSSSDLPPLADLLHASKLRLTINRLLFRDWPNDAAQKAIYSRAIESGQDDPSVERLKVVDNDTGDIIGFLALTRHCPVKAEQLDDRGSGAEKPDGHEGLDQEVAAMVSETVKEITDEMNGIDHYSKVSLTLVLESD